MNDVGKRGGRGSRRRYVTGDADVDAAIAQLVELLPENVGERRSQFASQLITTVMRGQAVADEL